MKHKQTGSGLIRWAALAVLVAVFAVGPLFAETNRANMPAPQGRKSLPRIVELGRRQCFPCKMMVPMFEELKREYSDVLEVVSIDVNDDPDAISLQSFYSLHV